MRILHVDDEPDIRDIAQLSLELDDDMEVVSAGSAACALGVIESARPEVILLDVMMPEMDGPELLRTLRSRREMADIPVIFMTAAAQKRTIDELIALGAIGVISKPFDPMSLADEVRSIMDGG